MVKAEKHAPAESFLGQLQRGRGEGYRKALALPRAEAWPTLVECITHDPRLDNQAESRAEYYAALAGESGLDLDALSRYLRENDDRDESGWNTKLTVDTLTELARRQYRNAADVLCDYLSWGQWWRRILQDWIAVQDPPLQVRLTCAIEQRFPTDAGLEESVGWCWPEREPWPSLGRCSPRIGKLMGRLREEFNAASELKKRSLPDPSSVTVRQLLERVDEKNQDLYWELIEKVVKPSDIDLLVASVSLKNPFMAYVALKGLVCLAPPSVFEWLQEFRSANPDMPARLHALIRKLFLSMPPNLTLPLARQWIGSEEVRDRFLAELTLEAHATVEDVPLLRRVIVESLPDDEENCYRVYRLLKAFTHLNGIGVVSELEDAFVRFRFSCGRISAAKAIQATAPDQFQDQFALECLWDCEEQTRELGSAHVACAAGPAEARLRQLAGDTFECEQVRAAAASRITSC